LPSVARRCHLRGECRGLAIYRVRRGNQWERVCRAHAHEHVELMSLPGDYFGARGPAGVTVLRLNRGRWVKSKIYPTTKKPLCAADLRSYFHEKRILEALHGVGLYCLDDLRQVSDYFLLSLHGIGMRGLKRIRARLAEIDAGEWGKVA
jgi:hypothetical protein